MLKVMIFGAGGMAGHIIYTYLRGVSGYSVISVCHSNKINKDSYLIDIKRSESVSKLIESEKPDIIINCTGILNKNKDIPEAIYVNSYFPKWLEKYLCNTNTRIIHLSTDCVFSGKKGNYSEIDIPDGKDIYSETKQLGEINNNKDLTIRTSIIGPELKSCGTGLFHWFMTQKGTINGYSNAIWSGVTTLQLAKNIDEMIQSGVSGLFHLTSSTPINKYQLLLVIKEVFNTDIVINKDDSFSINKSLISIRKDFLFKVPDYKAMISEMKVWMDNNQDIYEQYYKK